MKELNALLGECLLKFGPEHLQTFRDLGTAMISRFSSFVNYKKFAIHKDFLENGFVKIQADKHWYALYRYDKITQTLEFVENLEN